MDWDSDPPSELAKCQICGRELGGNKNKHHLVPKSRGGKQTFAIHPVCHSKIHSVFTEKELERTYNTFEKLRAHPEMQKFIEWVKDKPVEFHTGHRRKK